MNSFSRRIALLSSFLCIANLVIPSLIEWWMVVLLSVFVLCVFPVSVNGRVDIRIKAVDKNRLILASIIVFPLFVNYIFKTLISNADSSYYLVSMAASLFLFAGGLYFIYTLISFSKDVGIDARDNRDNKVSNVVLVYYGLFSLVAMLFVHSLRRFIP